MPIKYTFEKSINISKYLCLSKTKKWYLFRFIYTNRNRKQNKKKHVFKGIENAMKQKKKGMTF